MLTKTIKIPLSRTVSILDTPYMLLKHKPEMRVGTFVPGSTSSLY